METNEAGDVRISSIDELLGVGKDPVAIKLDVEGWEADAVRGAVNTLSTREFVLAIEANWHVYSRNKIDPSEILRLVPGIDACSIAVAELPGRTVDINSSFIDEFPEIRQFTLNIVVSRTRQENPSW
jgi:hypothetical protein